MPRTVARISLLLIAVPVIVLSGCAAVRYPAEDRSINDYDYCIINERDSSGYVDEAKKILSESFIVISPNDPRLSNPDVRRKTCEAVVSWTRGFFSVTGWVEVEDYRSGDYVTIVQTRRGFLYVGAQENVLESLRVLAATRKDGPPLPPLMLGSVDAAAKVSAPQPAGESTSDLERRLREIDALHQRGVISEKERASARNAVLTGD